MKNFGFLLILVTIYTGCFPAYKINPKSDRNFKVNPIKPKLSVYIINSDSLPLEAKILEFTGLYKSSSYSDLITNIKLYPIKKQTHFCGNAMIGSIITLGLIPSRFPDKYLYSYDVISAQDTIRHSIELDVTQQLWLFNMFSNKKNFKKQAGKAIAAQLSR